MSFIPSSLVIVVLAAAWTAPLKAQAPDFVRLGEIVQHCREDTGATDEDIQSIFMRKVPETRSGQCMLACAGQELGLMHDGTLDAEGTLAVAGRLLQGRDKKIQDAVKNAIMVCAEHSAANGSQDSCEAAAQLANCGLDQAHRVNTRRTAKKLLKQYPLSKSTYNVVEEEYLAPQPSHSMKSLHSKTSSKYHQPNRRVRRQSGQNQYQPQPQTGFPSQNQGTNQNQPNQNQQSNYPNQYPNQQYPNQQYPNQPYPLQTYPNTPVDQTLRDVSALGAVLNPNPYYQPVIYPNEPYVQPVVVANPFVVPVRGKRSPQELVLTSTEIALPPEAAAQISERLRELLLALISAQDGLNSTETTEKDAEVIESATRAPRRRRDQPSENKQGSPIVKVFDAVRDQVDNGPLHQLFQGFGNRMSTTGMNNTSTTTSSPSAQMG